jgi:hypothetical protein
MSRRSTLLLLVAATASVLLLSSLTACSRPSEDGIGQPLSASASARLKSASDLGLQLEQIPPYTSMQGIAGESTEANAKPKVLYVGADFCPYCAATRWPLSIALMRFGTLKGLKTMRSSATDVYPNTTTLSFADASYSSPYIRFQAVETADRNGKALQPLNGDNAKLFQKYDVPPYASHPGGIPFLYIGGRWLLLDAPVNPRAIGDGDWNAIASRLAQPGSSLAEAVLPQANLITAAICETTGNKPEKVCRSPGVIAASSALPPQ